MAAAAPPAGRPPSVSVLLRRVTDALWAADAGAATDLQRDAQAQWVRLLLAEVARQDGGAPAHHPAAVAAVAAELRHLHGRTRGGADAVLAGLAVLTKAFGA